jgi:hypothetical protein
MGSSGVVQILVLGRLFTADAGAVAVSCSLEYSAVDPWAVTLTLFERSSNRVPWMFSRELLFEGMTAAVNPGGSVAVSPVVDDGDPRGSQVQVDLSNAIEGRRAVLLLPRAPVAAFLIETYRHVPAGSESAQIDWDPQLRAWTGEGWAA